MTNILIVDDCDDVRDLLTLRLTNLGFNVFQAAEGFEALHILEKHKEITFVLLDIIMPKISGL